MRLVNGNKKWADNGEVRGRKNRMRLAFRIITKTCKVGSGCQCQLPMAVEATANSAAKQKNNEDECMCRRGRWGEVPERKSLKRGYSA